MGSLQFASHSHSISSHSLQSSNSSNNLPTHKFNNHSLSIQNSIQVRYYYNNHNFNMVSIKDIRKSNADFKSSDQASGLVAVFVGSTSGIGMGSLKQFAKNAKAPKIYILGRSKKAAAPLLDEIQKSNPEGKYDFIETEISLIKNVDKACDEIKSKETKVDLVFTSYPRTFKESCRPTFGRDPKIESRRKIRLHRNGNLAHQECRQGM